MAITDETSPGIDYSRARTGMWLFLVTEIFTAWGMFLIYSTYRSQFPGDFLFAGSTLDILPGFLSTIVLISGSVTINLATLHWQRKNREFAVLFLSLSVLLGLFFLIIKSFEWIAKFNKGLYPGSKLLQTHPPGEGIFYSIYYLVTGFHGLLVLAGTVSLAVLLFIVWRQAIAGKIDSQYRPAVMIKMENTALLWHTLVLIWIFLFPLFYLLT